MFVLIESIRSALVSIRAHRLRSFLTSLGIIIGVGSVITVISLIQGLSATITKQFEEMGGSTLNISSKNEFKDIMRGKYNYLPATDIEQLRTRVAGIRDLNPLFSPPGGELRFGSTSAFARVIATTPSFQAVENSFAGRGRFINQLDDDNARRVAVIGTKIIETLHLPEDPVGQFILYNKEWFKIIGVMEKRGEVFGFSRDDYMIIPFRTGQSLIGNSRQVDIRITVSLQDMSRVEETKDRIAATLRAAHRLKPEAQDDFEISSSEEMQKKFAEISATVTLVAAGIVGIALLVGGIGIMNIMLVSVTERTREIGICKAIGARSRDIMMQFLIEAVTLSVMGGAIGLAFGYGLGFSIAKLIPNFPDAVVPWWAVALAFLFSAGVGIVFGVVPASKAAKLDPIDALRYE